MGIEKTILSNLIHNESYARQVLPFVEDLYFEDFTQKSVFQEIKKFFLKYNSSPSRKILSVEIGNEQKYKSALEDISDLLSELDYTTENDEWLVEETEKFCKKMALFNAILESVNIIDGKSVTHTPDSIPNLLTDALGVCFDNRVGLNYIDDVEFRFNEYTKIEKKLPFDLDSLNKITDNGMGEGTLNLVVAGCVHPDTKVKVRFRKSEWTEKEIKISKIDELLKGGNEVEVFSSDGWVGVNYFVDKGLWDEYVLITEKNKIIRCNENHLFETTNGWVFAKDLVNEKNSVFLTEDGFETGVVYKTGEKIPIVDINVNHENHRYYTNGVSSHNTGVGKSLMMCHIASRALLMNKNVLYISLEMSEIEIAKRIDGNILNVDSRNLKNMDKDVFINKVDRINSKIKGKLIIKQYPTKSAHCGHFNNLLRELRTKQNFIPDLVVIDYLGICASANIKNNGNVNSYSYIKEVAEEMRGFAIQNKVPVFSGAQVTRNANTDSDFDISAIAESFGIMHTADICFALIETPELKELGQIMIKQLKNRYAPKDDMEKFLLGLDKSKSKFYELEGNPTNGLAQKPTQVSSGSSFATSQPTAKKFSGFKF